MIMGNVGYDNFWKLNLFFFWNDINNYNDKKLLISIIIENNVVLIEFFIFIFICLGVIIYIGVVCGVI